MNKKILDLIGNTPIINFNGLYLKLEYFNPSGSIKDRMSLEMIEDLERKKVLKKGDTIIEATSGNTGISVSMIAAIKGYKVVIIMNNYNYERIKTMECYGAKVIVVNSQINIERVAEKLSKRCKFIYLDQHHNVNNYLGYNKMAGEILKDFKEKSLDILVAGIGTGGTICGLASKLKKHFPKMKVIGVLPVNPKNSQLLGINSTLEEVHFQKQLIDKVYYLDDNEGIKTKRICNRQGLFIGNSAGAIINVGMSLKKDNKNANILCVIPDNNYKYLS